MNFRGKGMHPLSLVRLWVGGLAVLSLSACADMGFPERWELGGLRVLALQADSPEVNPLVDGSFTITPIVSDLDGAGRVLNYTIEFCYDPAVAYGSEPDCANQPEVLGEVTSRSGVLGGLATPHFTGAGTEAVAGDFSFTVPAAVLSSLDVTANAVELNNGVPYSGIFTVTDPITGESAKSFRRISATTRTPLNANPVINGILDSDGVTLSGVPTSLEGTELQADVPDGTAESYISLYRDGSQVTEQEEIRISWYSSSGEYSSGQSLIDTLVTFTPPDPADVSSGDAISPFLYAIVRDDRGGVGFLAAPVGP